MLYPISSNNLFFLCFNIISIFINNINSFHPNLIQNNNSILVDQSKTTLINNLILTNSIEENICLKSSNDLNSILNYNGGKIEPEWEWVKNISIVYTWVDGSDINFQDLKSKYNGGITKANNRDRSADELQYSIRSLEKYMPWHQGTIYIVTCQQIPKWLDINHPRVRIIDHKTIFPKYIFPTFDSGTIELFFDKIPGISEKFIYFNDDVFLNNYIHPSFFFTKDGFPKIYKNNDLLDISERKFRRNISNKENMFTNMCYLTRKLIWTYFDKDFQYYRLKHTPHVFYRDLMEPFRQYFKEDLKVLCIDKFRNWEKFHSLYLFLTFMKYASKNSQLNLFDQNNLPNNRTIKNYSCEIIPDSKSFDIIKFGRVTNDSKSNKKKFKYIKTHPNIHVFNFNDDYSKHHAFLQFTEFMMTRFPEASSFEKKEYIELENLAYSKLQNLNTTFNKTLNNSINEDIKYSIKHYKKIIIEEFLNKKEELSGPKKNISDREKEEIEFLLNYNGEKLDYEWEWAKKISIVYIFDKYYWSNEERKKIEIKKLEYSIRSIEKYLPWFEGNIYIVIDEGDQKEFELIHSDNHNIFLINQNRIIPKMEKNDEFKRYVIEIYLDKIPGLSEQFIYMKNNHFFINYTHPRFFFNKEFFPKYNFERILSSNKVNKLKENDKSFFNTYKIIINYFGKTYVHGYQYLKNAPYPLYRDLFGPTRQLYNKYIKKLLEGKYSKNNVILPQYMITTYNIYGTNHPYYPNYIGGYGKVRNSKLPVLNPSRKINFYGFDITSPAISNYTMIIDISFTKIFNEIDKPNDIICEEEFIEKIISQNKLFFSIKDINEKEIDNKYRIDCLFNIMNHLYNKNSYV